MPPRREVAVKVVVTGATGLVGRALVPALLARGDEVVALTRDAARAASALGPRVTAVTADLQAGGAWSATLAGAGAVVHLAGEPIAGKRWDARQRQVVRDTRVESARAVVEAIAALPAGQRPTALITASGTDYSPFAEPRLGDDDEITEDDPPGETYLARVCRDWEAEARAAEELGVRVAAMRTGIVLGSGGALARMTTPFKLFAGGRIGRGDQWMSWIHLDDAVAAYEAAVHDDRYRGPLNLVADSIRNRDFARALGAALGRPSWLPVPAFALRAAVGELAEYLLHGRRVVPARLRALGFAWRYPGLPEALAAALR